LKRYKISYRKRIKRKEKINKNKTREGEKNIPKLEGKMCSKMAKINI